MSDKQHKGEPDRAIASSITDGIRQLWFPAEFRIAAPEFRLEALTGEAHIGGVPVVQPVGQPVGAAPVESPESNGLVAEVATCLWYLKTKHFKCKWDDTDANDDDPRVRRALGRLNKVLDVLKENGIEIDDPTDKRYPQGGEGMMRPIEFVPTAGLTFERVTETVVPIIYRNDRLIQRGEVFVAVPQDDGLPVSELTTKTTEPDPQQTVGESENATTEGSTDATTDDAVAQATRNDTPTADVTSKDRTSSSTTATAAHPEVRKAADGAGSKQASAPHKH